MQFYGRQANDFPQDWIQEFQVLTNGFTAEYGQAAGGVLNVITRSGANTINGRALRLLPRRAVRQAAVRRSVRCEQEPGFPHGDAAVRAAAVRRIPRRPAGRRTSCFTSPASSALGLNASEVLGISDYWRQFVTDTIVPTGQRSTVGLVKVDLNVDTNNRGYFRYTNTHKRDSTCRARRRIASGPLNTLETRQTFGGPLWNILG